MHSPYEAVYGFDRTCILRMTTQEYLNESDVPIAATSSRQGKGGGRVLRSRDPNVHFCSKYLVYDQTGRELCVLYQMLETEVRQELCRVEQGGDVVRKSGVCLGAEAPLDDGHLKRTVMLPQRLEAQGAAFHPAQGAFLDCEGKKEDLNEEVNNDDNFIDVSASSRQFSSTAISSTKCTDTGMQDARGSSFSIYRDSGGLDVCTKLLGAGRVSEEQQKQDSYIALNGCDCRFTSQRAQCGELTAYMPYYSGNDFGLPPQRSNTASPQRFANNVVEANLKKNSNSICCYEGTKERNEEETMTAAPLGGKQVGEGGNYRAARATFDLSERADPLRFTTVRASELRTTKELFAPGRAMGVSRRTVNYSNPIPCQAYGQQSKAISAALVAPLIASNLEAVSCGGHFCDVDGLMPQLRPCTVVTFGEERRCRIFRYFASSDVYEARDGEAEEPGDSPQILIYRWSVRAVQQGLNEAHRAALGMSFVAPSVVVSGYRYRDGGITVITMPKGYDAVSLSTIPLTARSFPTCIKLLLRMLSDLVVKRTVHGNLRGLNQIFLALRGEGASLDLPAALLVPVHWEGLVDFSMFVDRNAGRTIPMEYEDIGGGRCERVNHGQDVSMVVNMLLENELAEQLQPEQLAEAHRLVMMTAEPTQVANYLIQLKNTMTVIVSDMVSLQQEYEVALRCQC